VRKNKIFLFLKKTLAFFQTIDYKYVLCRMNTKHCCTIGLHVAGTPLP
jgi:hypothetical protein